MARILIADDQQHIRAIVGALLAEEPGLNVCGEAENGQMAINQCKLLQPDLIILDIRMPVMNGFDAAQEIHRSFPKIAILMLTADESPYFASAAKTCGATGFLSKATANVHLLPAISTLLRGDTYFHSADADLR